MSSSDLSLVYLFVAPCGVVEDFARNVSFDAADCFEFRMALGYSAPHAFLGLWIRPHPARLCDQSAENLAPTGDSLGSTA